ncbi:MAG: hypothetical protein LCH85_17090 [Chloroflexi bacterium]|nr:hypothetical protein [Chloroflexota bacterium]
MKLFRPKRIFLIISLLFVACGRLTSDTTTHSLNSTTIPLETSVLSNNAYPLPIASIEPISNDITIPLPQAKICSFNSSADSIAASSRAFNSWNFTPPQTIVQSLNELAVIQWLPDNERLLYVQRTPQEEMMATIHKMSRNIVNYGERYGGGTMPPVWSTYENGVLYLETVNQKKELKLQKDSTKSSKIIAQSIDTMFLPQISPTGQFAVYSLSNQPISFWSTDDGAIFKQSPFSSPLEEVVKGLIAEGNLPSNWTWNSIENSAILYDMNKQYLMDLSTSSICSFQIENPYTGHHWIYNAQWNSDGRQLALLLSDGTHPKLAPHLRLAIFDTLTGMTQHFDLPYYIKDVEWLDTNTILMAIDSPNQSQSMYHLMLLNIETGEVRSIFEEQLFVSNLYKEDMVLSPDRKNLAVVTLDQRNGQYQLQMIEVQ